MPSEVSDEEIAREYNTLRNLRRRSASTPGPGALPVDPDLPPPSPSYPESSTSSTYSSNDDITLSTPDGLDPTSSGLFWVPAHLHPELAPGEFRAFLKSHTQVDPENGVINEAGGGGFLARRNSSLKGKGEGLGRKRSMLSKQYQPRMGDGVEEEVPPLPLGRGRGSLYGRGSGGSGSGEKGLTLEDLQRLEMLVEGEGESGEGDDSGVLRSVLRRSLSTNVAPGFLNDDVPLDGEGNPVPPPRPGSILRRSARTKIRKAGLVGDGGGHRFAATRKGRTTAAPVIDIPGLEDDDDAYSAESNHRRRTMGSDESGDSLEYKDAHEQLGLDNTRHFENTRRGSDASTDETAIFDAYARASRSGSTSEDDSFSASVSRSPSPEYEDGGGGIILPPLPKMGSQGNDWFKTVDGEKTPTQETMGDPLGGYKGEGRKSPPPPLQLHQEGVYTPDRDRRSTSPTTPKRQDSVESSSDLPPGMAPPITRSIIPPGIAMQQQHQIHRQPSGDLSQVHLDKPSLTRIDSTASSTSSTKEKEKKGGFFSKKDKKDKDKDKKGKEKDGFLGSLFGTHKKKVEEPSSIANFSSAGPAAAAALLGSSKSAKSMGQGNSPVPSPTSPGFSNFARYPIHVERAVYRLSHIKLANARRPLYEQVLISNLMFWYLGVIGRNVADEKEKEKEKEEKGSGSGKREEEKEPSVKVVAKGTPAKPVDVGSAGKALPRGQPEPVAKKVGLTKPDRSRGAGSRGEMGVKGPSYGMQNAQVDSEMRNMGMGMGRGGMRGGGGMPQRSNTAPLPQGAGLGYPQQQHPSSVQQQQHSQQQHPSQIQQHPSPTQQHPPQNQQHPSPQQSQQQQPPPQSYPRSQAYHQLPYTQAQPSPPQQNHLQPPPPQYAQQPQRALSTPPPQSRGLSPPNGQPQNQPQFRPLPDHSQNRPPPQQQQYPGIIPPPPRAAPQSSFGPPPPINPAQPPLSQSQQMDPRQRTMSNPHPGPPPIQTNSGMMRRVVTDGRSPPGHYPQSTSPTSMHAGPQPGQIFSYSGPNNGGPSTSRSPIGNGPQPGQLFNPNPNLNPNPVPGQLFTHPQYGNGNGGNRPPPVLGGRLPPGAAPPGGGGGGEYLGAPAPQHLRRGPSPDGHVRGPGQGQGGGAGPGQGFYNVPGAGPGPGMGVGQVRPPQMMQGGVNISGMQQRPGVVGPGGQVQGYGQHHR